MRDEFLPYCRPATTESEIAAAAQALRKGWLTTGPRTAAFEASFAAACGVPHAVALNSCTAGLHLAFAALGIGPGDEVVMPSLTFAAGAQCTLELGARPIFCDVDRDTLSIDWETVEAALTPQTKAVVAMPYAGRPLHVEQLCDRARERGIAVVEDAAHAAGTLDGGAWAGLYSDAAVYSFYATKNLTTGEGGMLVTRDLALADRVRRLSLHGMSRDAWKRYTNAGSWQYDVLEPGFKYNITDIASSIGLVQLRRLDEMQRRRDEIAAQYRRELSQLPGIAFQREPDHPNDRHSWCMFVIVVDETEAGVDRDTLFERLRDCNIGTSVHYIPTHRFSAYRDLQTAPLPNTEWLADRILSLPLYPTMTDDDVADVIDAMTSIVSSPKKVPISH